MDHRKKPPALSMRTLRVTDCKNCGGTGWVCENHTDRVWRGVSDDVTACGCGDGAPCAICNSEESPKTRWDYPRRA